MNTARTIALLTSAIAVAVLTLPAGAQSIPASSSAPDDPVAPTSSVTEGDIIVTAQKRAQTLIDVPQSVSVVSGATLEQVHAQTFSDYLKLVPGLQLNQSTPGEGRLTIRGLNTGGVASTVAVYEDETPFGSSSGLANGAILAGDFDTFDVARIEVLRGPQGTLYGASSLGGVLKFVTNEPDTTKVAARARGGVETTDGGGISYYGNAVLNFPISDTLAVRASGTYIDDAGWIDAIGTPGTGAFGNTLASQKRNDINSSRNYGGRASLLWKPGSVFSLRLSALLQNVETDAPAIVESDPNTLRTLYGRETQSIVVSPYRDISYRSYNGLANVDLGFATLTSSTSFGTQRQTRRADEGIELGGLTAAVFKVPSDIYLGQITDLKKFTQEVRLASAHSSVLDLVVGGFYTHEKGLIFQLYHALTPGTLTEITTLPLLARVNLASTYEEIAGFANATVHFGPHFDLDLGGRESRNRQRADQTLEGVLVSPAVEAQRSSESVLTYSVAPKIKFGSNASLYGRVAKGFRPGGPNALAPGADASFLTYRSDSVVSYEVGVKAQTEDRTFSIEAATFHIDWNDIQLITSQTTAAGSFNFNTNGGRARSDGAEVTATIRPIQGFDVSIVGAYNNAYLKDPTTVPVGGFAGDKLPFTPRYTVGTNGNYRWTLDEGVQAYLGGSLRFLSKQNGSFDRAFRLANGRQRELPSYEVVDLQAGLDLGRFAVEVYAKNVNNAEGKTSTSTLGLYPAGAIGTGVIRPRTIGLSLTASY